MRITALTVENFKGIREPARIEIRPVTLLFGANSSGKSTIVQALHYLHEILERHNVDPGRTLFGGGAIDLGGFETLVHGHQRERVIRIRADMVFSSRDLPEYFLPWETMISDTEVLPRQRIVGGWVEIAVAWSEILNKPIVETYEVGINDSLFATIEASRDLENIRLSFVDLLHPLFREPYTGPTPEQLKAIYQEWGGLEYDETDHPAWQSDLESVATRVLDPINLLTDRGTKSVSLKLWEQADAVPVWGRVLDFRECFLRVGGSVIRPLIESLTSLISGPGELLRDSLRTLRYVGPLRQVPPRNFEPIRSPDEARWAIGLGAWDTLAKGDASLVEQVNRWLVDQERLNSGYRLKVKRYKEIEVQNPLMVAIRERRALEKDVNAEAEIETSPTRTRVALLDEATGIEVLPQDVGIGLSQLIPVIVAALARPGITAIEQPELHIHPAWQVVLGDLFLTQAKETDATFLIETHSEHLVLRIMRRMRETFTNSLPPNAPAATTEDVVINFVEVDQRQTIVREMPLNEAGDLVKAWPGGFFEERLPEMLG